MGVNQGGNASGFLFRKYMADLSDYLKSEFGVTIGSTILAHILWADDLILLSDTLGGIQKQLDGLKHFCSKNQMSVNELKTKIMVFGTDEKISVYFNNAIIEQVEQYKYVGCIIQSIKRPYADPFKLNYTYLCDQARRALFGIKHRLKSIGSIPPKALFHLINTSIKPILAYGSDVWGIYKYGRDTVDKMFLQIMKRALGVKQSTSTMMVYGETGQFPPSINCLHNTLCFLNRISYMNTDTLVRQVYEELGKLQACGFNNWYGKAWELMNTYGLSINSNHNHFKKLVKNTLKTKFANNLLEEILNVGKNPITRTYSLFKQTFGMESYLDKVSNFKYRQAISRLRVSSHDLMVEKGRQHLNKLVFEERLCPNCKSIEDEIHFLVCCPLYSIERKKFYEDIELDEDVINNVNPTTLICLLMNLKHKNHLEKLGAFIYFSFNKRRQFTS